MDTFFAKVRDWEVVFPDGCSVVLYGDGSGHVRVQRRTKSGDWYWHVIYAFEEIKDFLSSVPENIFMKV